MNASLSLTETLDLLRSGALSSGDHQRACREAIEAHRPLNAFRVVHGDGTALCEGPLRGVAIALKDNLDEAGQVCAAGCRAYLDRVPAADAPVVARLRRAGAVILGRTSMHELADGATSENVPFGPVHNPWRQGFHPGGSSGGSAVAVAAGLVPAALGTDTGGSVRVPAALCGVVGLKPTAGRVPTEGVMPLSTTLDHVGPIARTVADVALLLGILAEGTFVQAAAPLHPRVGILSGFTLEPDPGVQACFAEALRTLEAAGCVLQDVRIPGIASAMKLLARIYGPEAGAWHRARLEERPGDFTEDIRQDLLRGLAQAPEKYRSALEERRALSDELARVMDDVDFLVCPATPHPARPFGCPDPHTYLTYTCPFNLSGQPALSVPMGTVDGLPVGLQLAGRRGEDGALLALGVRFGA